MRGGLRGLPSSPCCSTSLCQTDALYARPASGLLCCAVLGCRCGSVESSCASSSFETPVFFPLCLFHTTHRAPDLLKRNSAPKSSVEMQHSCSDGLAERVWCCRAWKGGYWMASAPRVEGFV